jgi:hypothetical protein
MEHGRQLPDRFFGMELQRVLDAPEQNVTKNNNNNTVHKLNILC